MKTTKLMRIISCVLGVILLFGCLAGCGGTGTKEPKDNSGSDDKTVYKLKIDYPNPENSAIYPVLVKWAEWCGEKSDGRLDIKIYSGGALGSIMDCVSNCEAGVTDGFWSAMNLYPGIWPLCDVFMLPMLGAKGVEAQDAAIQEMMQKEEFASQFDNVHLVAIASSTPASFIFANEVTSMKDVNGVTVRSFSNYASPWLKSLGAVPVSVSSNDGYESLSKNVVGGGLWYLDQIQSSALYEVIKTCFYGEMCYPSLFLALNKDVYAGLPEDLQKVIDESADYYLSLTQPAYFQQEDEVFALLKEHNVKVYDISAEDSEWLTEHAQAGWDVFNESVGKLGYDGQKYIDEMRETIAKYNKEFYGE